MLAPDIVAHLQLAVAHALKDAWGRREPDTGTTLADIASAMRKLCDASILSVVRALERGPAELPDEIWGHIWSYLRLCDLVAATHVCRAWRTMALDNSTLWGRIILGPMRHVSSCECVTCCGIANLHERPRYLDQCIGRLEILLDRSKNASLDVTLGTTLISEPRLESGPFGRICGILCRHSSRLVSLELLLPCGEWVRILIYSLETLPCLRRLEIRNSGSTGLDCSLASTLAFSPMPNLATLNCGDSVKWDQMIASAPAVLSLCTCVWSVAHLENVLHSFPAFRELSLAMDMSDWSETSGLADLIRERCGQLQILQLTRVPARLDATSLALLVQSRTPDVTIVVSQDFPTEGADSNLSSCTVLSTLAQLSGSISLVFTDRPAGLRFSIIARDAHRVRKLELPQTWPTAQALKFTWTEIAASSIVSLDFPWVFRTLVLATLASLPALEHLTIIVPWSPHDPFSQPVLRKRLQVEEPYTLAEVPSLNRISMKSNELVSLSAAMTSEFFERLLAGRRVGALATHNVRFEGSVQRIEAVADEVLVTFDPIPPRNLV
ncbi:hypothetical protein EXIGLDRAFT_835622 [Exidia glandulosa HHB12029]|uniref:F-box domain-containing protein n=1 Tax=Exidia glandulosa HHB12029 TaxID=1314781 RepID=A0A165IL51_EXIGL|nr:hypothetical protein EXIGLDRAFT_835622 [Exidia glandulosa HHB12029]